LLERFQGLPFGGGYFLLLCRFEVEERIFYVSKRGIIERFVEDKKSVLK
jgi:hypothetical protein